MAITLTQEMIEGAQYTESITGVPASITLAQIIEESSGKYSGGMSGLAYFGNNLFGVKSFSDDDEKIFMQDGNGQTQAWKKYNTVYDSIIDHARVISLDRYKTRYQNATSVEDYANALQSGGYAGTSTTYASKLMQHINKYNLNQYNAQENYKNSEDKNNDSNNMTNVNKSDSDDLTWIGDILKYVAIVLLLIIVVFFLFKALNIETDIKDKVKKKIKKKVENNEKENE